MPVKEYRSILSEAGYPEKEIQMRVRHCFQEIFYGPDRFYYPVGPDMAVVVDTGNHDVRTEGMSYGMMMCVQMDRKEEFDRLWKWVMTYMYMENGFHSGYFAWSCSPTGAPNASGPAPDGEEYFAMALFFASHRWGDGEEIFQYSEMARSILRTCLHKEDEPAGRNMWDRERHLIRFVPEEDFTDPSYHLPHFYELFSQWADEADREFWREAAQASRRYLQRACHPRTGLSPEYSTFDGEPWRDFSRWGRHDWYYSDAYRTIANIAMDYCWFGQDRGETWQRDIAGKIQRFFLHEVPAQPRAVYSVEGEILGEHALHPVAMTAVNAQGSLTAESPLSGDALQCVREFWNTPLRTGDRRYYDNCLYFFAALSLSGMYRIW